MHCSGTIAAYVVAVIAGGLSLLAAILYLTSGENYKIPWGLLFLFDTFLYTGVIIGLKKKRPAFFLPYLIMEAIYIVCYALFALFLIVSSFFSKSTGGGIDDPADEKLHKGLKSLLETGLTIFFYIIILMAYQKIKQEKGEQLPTNSN